jgi:hypothetical protein
MVGKLEFVKFGLVVWAALFFVGVVQAQPPNDANSEEQKRLELQKATQNPVADLISVPFQSNFNFGQGGEGPTREQTQYILNIQPVIPFELNEDWNLITRTIVPIINQPSLFSGMESAWGFGDINPSFFLSPAKPGEWIWGVGPTFTFPTATDETLGQQKYSAGPTAVVLKIQGPWVYGALANNQWSYAGWGEQSVNQMLIQPFVNYNMEKGWYYTASPIITANWEADGGNQWTLPVGGGVGRLFKMGKMPVNMQLAVYYNVEKPDYVGADWQLRFQVQFLFPK